MGEARVEWPGCEYRSGEGGAGAVADISLVINQSGNIFNLAQEIKTRPVGSLPRGRVGATLVLSGCDLCQALSRQIVHVSDDCGRLIQQDIRYLVVASFLK